MKPFLLKAFGVFALCTAVSLTSCNEDPCKAVRCANNGVCEEDGSCTCPTGYEGERCETVTRDKFKGAWTVTEDGTASRQISYAVSVENGHNIDEVIIRNFNNLDNTSVTAKVKGDSIFLSNQPIQTHDGVKTVEGFGYVYPESFYGLHGRIDFHYQVVSEDGSVNIYGLGGSENPSLWTK